MTKAKDPGTGYEAARDELVGIVAKLEAGGISLEESVALWERGEVCTDLLDSARQAVAEAESPAATD